MASSRANLKKRWAHPNARSKQRAAAKKMKRDSKGRFTGKKR